nr:phospho-N-acetylmuramoyl-pentapeptide-transferase [Bacilli bacterium]
MITKTFLVMMISFILSLILGFILIPIFKNKKIDQRLNRYLEDTHRSKKNTPTMGGIVFVLSTLITTIFLLVFGKIKMSNSLFIIIFTFISYALIGFIDDYLIIKRGNNEGLKEYQKLLLQLFVSVIFFLIFIQDNEPVLWIHTFNIRINIGFLYGLFILFVLVSSSNAVNLTDGLDGLATGLSIIAFITFGILSYNTGWLDGYKDIGIFAFALVGSLLGFLFFNSHPAKIFMGDTGSLSLGATLGTYAILTRHELLLVLIGIVFVLETLSCIIQRIYYKFTKKRVFLMTPIHHTFEKMGYKETDIVRMFWIVGLIASMISLAFGIWL